ncbi:unnamed protein product [Auanema sp. JU1783]|nr:unnamed protein product [Auanema sp. JU1783]
MATEVRRDRFKTFWDKYSDKPDTNTMMLNHSADDLESADRTDILACLPQVTNKDVVDIGAGIGRFTTVLAESAKSVLSTDFIESFISKNKERNAHMGNVQYQIGDAVHLVMDNTSVDLVFTNWLMMYLSDSETIEFLMNCMKWLRPNGYVHLRESCSEPSTGRSKTNTMHSTSEANPTHYRFSSLYITLLRNIRYQDAEGKIWKFNVEWSCSVPTYIQYQNNWRQVHWLAKKVPAEETKPTSPEDLLELFSKVWYEEQVEWDKKLDGEKYVWTDKIFANVLNDEIVAKNSAALVYTPRASSPYTHINSHLLAENFTCNVWNIETKPYLYRTSLTRANTIKDKRVRFAWNDSLASSINYWIARDASFESFIATELLSSSSDEELTKIQSIMNSEANVVLLEPVDEINEEAIKKKLSLIGLKKIIIKDVTTESVNAQKEYFTEHQLTDDTPAKKWILIQGHL